MILLKQTNHKHSMKTSRGTDLQSQQTTVGETETTSKWRILDEYFKWKMQGVFSIFRNVIQWRKPMLFWKRINMEGFGNCVLIWCNDGKQIAPRLIFNAHDSTGASGEYCFSCLILMDAKMPIKKKYIWMQRWEMNCFGFGWGACDCMGS